MTTQNKSLNVPANNSTNWDTALNANFSAIDAALGGVTLLNVTNQNTTPVVLTLSQYTNQIIFISGALTANVTFQVPSTIGGEWTINNSTSGSFSVTIGSGGGGSSVAVAQGKTNIVYSDGTNIIISHSDLPTTAIATASTVGVVKPGSNMAIDNSGNIAFVPADSIATASVVGTVKTGSGIAIASDGTISGPMLTQGRLSLISNVPVMNANAIAVTTVFWVPYQGNSIPIWNGTVFIPTPFAQLAAGIGATTANNVYDLYVWNNAGTMTLTYSPAWLAGGGSNTVRGSGAGSAQQATVNGIVTNAQAISGGPAAGYGTYVGTFMTDAGGATVTWNTGSSAAGGGMATLGLWNEYNRKAVVAFVNNSTSNWSIGAVTWRAANLSNTFRVTFVIGESEDVFSSKFSVVTNTGNSNYSTGIGLDSLTSPTGIAGTLVSYNTGANVTSDLRAMSPSGAHFLQALESSTSGNNNINYSFPTLSGLMAQFKM